MKLYEIVGSSVDSLKEQLKQIDDEYNNVIKRNDLWFDRFGTPLYSDEKMKQVEENYFRNRKKILDDLKYTYSMGTIKR